MNTRYVKLEFFVKLIAELLLSQIRVMPNYSIPVNKIPTFIRYGSEIYPASFQSPALKPTAIFRGPASIQH